MFDFYCPSGDSIFQISISIVNVMNVIEAKGKNFISIWKMLFKSNVPRPSHYHVLHFFLVLF